MDNKYKDVALKIQGLEITYAAFSAGMNVPYVTCDPETYNDQVWIFTTEEKARAFVAEYKEKQVSLLIAKMENKQLLSFYSTLYSMDINEVVLVDGETVHKVPLECIVTQSDDSQIPENKRPVSNPKLQLSGIYFMQEIRRQVPNTEKTQLKELEEEMAANLVRARFIMAVEVTGEKNEKGEPNVRIPFIKGQDGKIYQPLFTDLFEFAKFNKEKKFIPTPLPFENLVNGIHKELAGMVLNPMGTNIVILKDKLVLLQRVFGKA